MNLFRARWLLFFTGCVLCIAALVIVVKMTNDVAAHDATEGPSDLAVSNADVDPGSPTGDVPAPGFTLRDQDGRATSLAQFRGKVVVLAFVDSHCTTICPLMTESMVHALDLLGPAAARVQLIGINANPDALAVSDVAAYTKAHQMEGRWRFLTGSIDQLYQVWRDYNVYVAAVKNDIDHDPVVYLIGPEGRERTVYFTAMSYKGVAQQAQVLADGIARLLPDHPSVRQEVSLKPLAALKPDQTVQLPVLGKHPRQTVALGGTHPHLFLFFAGWLQEGADVRTNLAVLDRYAGSADQQDWPTPVAIDELSTETSATNTEQMLSDMAATLKTPIVEDMRGRLADGYGVQDLPWYVLSSPSGKILWHHDGWLSSSALDQQVRAALARD